MALWGSYLEFYKVIPKRNYFGVFCGYSLRGFGGSGNIELYGMMPTLGGSGDLVSR